MENKELATTKKITSELIGGWLLWGILFGIIYSFIFALITKSIESLVLRAIIAIVMQGIITFIIWKFSVKSTFKKRTMAYADVPTVMRNLIIFTIIICVINGIYNYSQINSRIDKAVNSDIELKYTESMMSYFYDDDEMAEYNKQKEATIEEAKNQARTYLVIIEIGLTVVYLAVLPLVKKEILKYVE